MLYAARQLDLRSLLARLPLLLGGVLLLVGVGACDGVGETDGTSNFTEQVATQTLNQGAVDIDEIDRGQYGGLMEGTRRVLRNESAYAEFWDMLHAGRSTVPDRPDVNFAEEVVVAVVLGQRPTGGYSVEIDDVLADETGSKIQVQFTETVPGDNCYVTQAITSPYVLATVKAQDEEVTFAGTEEAHAC